MSAEASDLGDWPLRAVCRDKDPELFHPKGEGEAYRPQTEQAKKVCARCPVEGECLQYALDNDEHGIWGGTTKRERTWLKKRTAAALALGGFAVEADGSE